MNETIANAVQMFVRATAGFDTGNGRMRFETVGDFMNHANMHLMLFYRDNFLELAEIKRSEAERYLRMVKMGPDRLREYAAEIRAESSNPEWWPDDVAECESRAEAALAEMEKYLTQGAVVGRIVKDASAAIGADGTIL